MRSLLPFLSWMRSYHRRLFASDLVAGITVGIVLIPQGMAYAMIAGLPPVYGLYTALVPVFIYAFFGSSRQLSVGPVAMDSLLVAAALGTVAIAGTENYIALAIVLTFMVGVIQLSLGLLRMGFLVNFLSKPVISGFTSAAALIIIFSQMRHLLGTIVPQSSNFYVLVRETVENLPQAHWLTVVVGIGGILMILAFRKWIPAIPSILMVVLLAILGSYLFGLQMFGLAIVGEIPQGLPDLKMPDFRFQYLESLIPMAIALAIIGYMEAISIAQSIDEKNHRDTVKPNQELLALGAANMLGSFFQSYTVTGSFSRSAINSKMESRTQVSGIIGASLVLLTLLFLTPVFYYLPNAILASIIMVSVVGLIEVNYPAFLWKHQRDEFFLLLFTFVTTLFLGIQQGILYGVLLSLIIMLFRSSKPHFAVLGKIRNSDYYKNVDRFSGEVEERKDLLIVRFDSQLFFGNRNYFKKELFKFIDARGPDLKGVILNAEAINYIDSTAEAMLVKVIKDIHSRGIKFYISGAIGPTRDIIFNSGIIDLLPKEHLFIRIAEAVEYFDKPATATALQEKIAYQNKAGSN